MPSHLELILLFIVTFISTCCLKHKNFKGILSTCSGVMLICFSGRAVYFVQKHLTLGFGAAEGLGRQQAAQKLNVSVYDWFYIPQIEFHVA